MVPEKTARSGSRSGYLGTMPASSVMGVTLRRSLSLIVIGISVFLLSIFDSDKNLTQLAFESVSAFGTVGLSLGITGALSDPGKMIIILTMFIGRVSMLTILVAFLRRIINLKYRYPIEDVLIN